MQLLDAQWLSPGYSDFSRAAELLTPGVSGRHCGRAGGFGHAQESSFAHINDIALGRLVTGDLPRLRSVQNRIIEIGAAEGARHEDQPIGRFRRAM
jgi:hypothetical protein